MIFASVKGGLLALRPTDNSLALAVSGDGHNSFGLVVRSRVTPRKRIRHVR